jgi:hypothetical protein
MAAAWLLGRTPRRQDEPLLTPRIDSSLTPDSICRLCTRISRGASCATLVPRELRHHWQPTLASPLSRME